MPIEILSLPESVWQASQCKMYVGKKNLVSSAPFSLWARAIGPVDERWVIETTFPPMTEDDHAVVSAVMSRLDGQSGAIRLYDPGRLVPRGEAAGPYDDGTQFDDATGFSDGTGFDGGGYSASLAQDEPFGRSAIVLSGLRPSQAQSIMPNDKFEVGGLLYHNVAAEPLSSDSNGRCRVPIRPRLRRAHRAGDIVSFNKPSSVFIATADDLGVERVPGHGTFGATFIEVPERVLCPVT